jgi:hypothetical protein
LSRFSPIGETSSARPHEPAQIQRIELAHALRNGAQWPVLKIQYIRNGEVVLTVSGRLQADHLGELTALIDADRSGRALVLDLKDLVRVDEDVVRFLCACERDGVVLRNCPLYIRTWMARESTIP